MTSTFQIAACQVLSLFIRNNYGFQPSGLTDTHLKSKNTIMKTIVVTHVSLSARQAHFTTPNSFHFCHSSLTQLDNSGLILRQGLNLYVGRNVLFVLLL